MSWFDTVNLLLPELEKGNIDKCINTINDIIRPNRDFPFSIACDLDFTNDPNIIAAIFNEFIHKESSKFSLKAIYTETNGFDINPDLWYFDIFSYEKYGGHDDYDWLAHWKGSNNSPTTLTGIERLQEVYASDAFYDSDTSDLVYHVSLMVVFKFQNLRKKSMLLLKDLAVPVLSTGHDYDIIYEFSC